MLAECLLIDARFIIETFHVRYRYQLHEIAIADVIFCKQDKMVALVGVDARAFVVARCVGDVNFTANDRLDASFIGLFVKFYGTVKHAMISERDSVHSTFFCARDKSINLAQPIEERVMRVGMKMDEWKLFGHKEERSRCEANRRRLLCRHCSPSSGRLHC